MNLHVEFAFTCGKVSFWVGNFPCFDFWQYAVQTEQAGEKRKWLSNFTKKRSGQFFNSFTEKSVRYSAHISSFTEKSVKYSKLIAQIWMPQCCRENLGDGLGTQLFLPFLEFWKLPALLFLHTQEYYIISSHVIDEVED